MRSVPAAFLLVVLLSSTPAGAYEVRKAASGTPLRWPEGSMSVTLALDGAPGTTGAPDALEAGWSAVEVYAATMQELAPGIRVEVEEVAATAAPDLDAHDGRNVIRWVTHDWDDDFDPIALAVTVTTYDGASGRITDADVAVNAQRYRWTATSAMLACTGAYDLQDVLTHELGHAFGLGHDSLDPEATMYPSADTCELKKRDLDDGDVAGLRYLYVEVGPAPAGGCALAGRPDGAVGALAVAVLLAAARSRRRRGLQAGLLLAAAVLLGAPPARATILVKLPLSKVSGGADLAVRGTVRAVQAIARGGRTYTDAVVSVEECLKGPCPIVLTVRQLGGEVDGAGTVLEGSASLAAGAEVLLFLRARRDGAYAPVGMGQGVLVVERDAGKAVRGYARDLRGVGLVEEDGTASRGAVERVTVAEMKALLVTPP